MQPDDLKAYLDRGWGASEALKIEHWAREFAEHGPEVTVKASRALWEHMRLVRPEWPSEDDRREDLAHHIRVKRAIDRAAGAFAPLPRH